MFNPGWISGVLLSGLLCGCGASETVRVEHSVTGKVTFNGQPVTEGTVQFEDAATGQGGGGALTADGSYSATLGAGSYKVAVFPPVEHTPDTEISPGGEIVKDVKNIPQQFRTFDTTPLSVTVTPEQLTHDFDLKL